MLLSRVPDVLGFNYLASIASRVIHVRNAVQ